jgi:hypothetical protein
VNRSDDFDRPGNVALNGATPSDGGSAWVDLSSGHVFATATDGGTGEVVCYESSPAGSQIAYLDAGVADVRVSLEVVRIDAQAGPAARVQDANNCYFFMADSAGATSLWVLARGSYTQLAAGTLTFTPGVGKTLALEARGTTLTGYVNGSVSATATDGTFPAGTCHGMRTSNNFNFENAIAITALSPPPPPAAAAYVPAFAPGWGGA